MTYDILGRLLLALVVGAVIGAERESRDKAAGLRTMTLICLGSALFTMFSIRIGAPDGQGARIAAQIVSGVGFLGAGAIMRDGPKVSGLTTAATIWLTASLGLGIGAGHAQIALAASGITMLVLLLLPSLEGVIDGRRESETYVVTCDRSEVDRLDAVVRASGLDVLGRTLSRNDGTATVTWQVIGRHSRHTELEQQLFDDSAVQSVTR